jgi:hypothetical protein
MKRTLFASCLLLGGCASMLQSIGFSPTAAATISTDALELGTLGCTYGPTVAAVVGVKVNGATSSAVADACAAISVAGQPVQGAVPTPLPSGAVVPVATVPAPVATAVIASIGAIAGAVKGSN